MAALLCAFSAATLLLLLLASPCRAVDGRLDVRDTRQEGQSGPTAYTTRNLQQEGLANHRVLLHPSWMLLLDLQARQELIESEFGGLGTDLDRLTRRGNSVLQYRQDGWSGQLHFGGFRRDTTPTEDETQHFDRVEFGALLNYRGDGPLLGRASVQETRSWRDESGQGEIETRERQASLNLETARWRHGALRYNGNYLFQDNRTQGVETTNMSHGLQYEGSRRFAQERGLVTVQARSQLFLQDTVRRVPGTAELLVLPLSGGYRIDNTPDVEDPLESPVIAEEALFDRDRLVPTGIDLGDEASVGQEFGGDYRNLQYDFGEPREIVRAILYVDRTLLFFELMQWDVYLSNDPAGQIWRKLEASSYTAEYREWGTALQGWDIRLLDPLAVQRLKLVNRKLGPLADEVFVTELETYALEPDGQMQADEHTWDHRLWSAVEYELSSEVRAGYDLILRRRTFSESERDLRETAHGLWSRWRRGEWFAAGRVDLQRIGSDVATNTDVKQLHLSGGKEWQRDRTLTLSYSRLDDDSRDVDRTTDALSLLGKWRVAPRLQLSQRVTQSWLDDRGVGADSRAFTLSSLIYSSPYPWLSVDLTRADRWVDEAGSAGFTRFNDTSLAVSLVPVPLISLTSNIRYQVRDRSDWLLRNTASWSPLGGSGSVTLRLSATHLRDTRVDSSLLGAGAQVVWKPRRFLTLEGSVESQRYMLEGVENDPLNTVLRGTWIF